jgi:hypothetical protein
MRNPSEPPAPLKDVIDLSGTGMAI